MLMCVYRHDAKGAESHAESKRMRRRKAHGARNIGNENQRVPGRSVTDDSRERAARGTPVSITNTAPPPSLPPSSFPRAASKEHNTSCLAPFLTPSPISLNSAPTGPQNPELQGWLNEQGRGGGRALMALLTSKAHLHLSRCFPAIQQTSQPETRRQPVVSHLSSIMT